MWTILNYPLLKRYRWTFGYPLEMTAIVTSKKSPTEVLAEAKWVTRRPEDTSFLPICTFLCVSRIIMLPNLSPTTKILSNGLLSNATHDNWSI